MPKRGLEGVGQFVFRNVGRLGQRSEGQLPLLGGQLRKRALKISMDNPELASRARPMLVVEHRISPRQIEERLELDDVGRSVGFQKADDLRKVGRLMFRVYDIALTLFFHGYHLSMTGDVFINGLDDMPDWKFHKGKYVACVSAYFDYKHERNMRKYGESRPWSPEGWPPKRL